MRSELQWKRASGNGYIYSFTVVRRAVAPVFGERLPLIVVLVDLVEGPRMLSNLVESTPEDVQIGDAVQVAFTQVDDGVVLPMFKPIGTSKSLAS